MYETFKSKDYKQKNNKIGQKRGQIYFFPLYARSFLAEFSHPPRVENVSKSMARKDTE